MKNTTRIIASTLTAALVACLAPPASALTNADIAGTYKGTSVATLPTGQKITAEVTITLKKGGNEKVVATVNGQTSTSKGRYQFVSDDIIVGGFSASEFTAFVAQDGDALTLTVLAKQTATGAIIPEITSLTKQ